MRKKICAYCEKANSVKNGKDRKGEQRYKCKEPDCGKTFTKHTSKEIELAYKKRIALHLILAGCEPLEIAQVVEMRKNAIVQWGRKYFNAIEEITPSEPLLSINTLIRVYRGIEKRRLSKLNVFQRKGKMFIRNHS